MSSPGRTVLGAPTISSVGLFSWAACSPKGVSTQAAAPVGCPSCAGRRSPAGHATAAACPDPIVAHHASMARTATTVPTTTVQTTTVRTGRAVGEPADPDPVGDSTPACSRELAPVSITSAGTLSPPGSPDDEGLGGGGSGAGSDDGQIWARRPGDERGELAGRRGGRGGQAVEVEDATRAEVGIERDAHDGLPVTVNRQSRERARRAWRAGRGRRAPSRRPGRALCGPAAMSASTGMAVARARLAGVGAHEHQSVGPAEKAAAGRGREFGAQVDHGHVVAGRLLCRAHHRGRVDRPDLEPGCQAVVLGCRWGEQAGGQPPRVRRRIQCPNRCPLGLWPGPSRAARRSWWSPSRSPARRRGSDGAAPTGPHRSGTRCPRPTRAPAPAAPTPARPAALLQARPSSRIRRCSSRPVLRGPPMGVALLQ